MSDVGRLRDEVALREASLADARWEREAGELSAEQFASIADRESEALARAQAELAALADAPSTVVLGRRVRKARWLVVATVCFAAALGFVLYGALAPRQAGSSATGGLDLGRSQHISQLLTEAEADVAMGRPVAALAAYRQVLVLDAHNVAALTESGWLDFSAGSAAHQSAVVELGIRSLETAVHLAPRNAAARLYLAIVADSTPGNRVVAKREFEVFLTLHPSVGQMAVATPFMKRLGLTP